MGRVSAPAQGGAGETLLSLAVLLEAGAAPSGAWRHLAASGHAEAAQISERIDDGSSGAAAIAAQPGTAWKQVAAAWEVAEVVGAPLGSTLRGVAASLRDAADLRDEVRVALAEPASSARLMAWLPLLGLVVGMGLGLDPLGVLFGGGIGSVCLGVGAALLVASHLWTRRIVRGAQPGDDVPGLREELLAIALSGGTSVPRAREIVADAADWLPGGSLSPAAGAERVLDLSRDAGVPAVELLRAEAGLLRQRARTEGRLRGARVGTRLLIPLGICTLPSFLCLGVAPMLLGVLQAAPLPSFAG